MNNISKLETDLKYDALISDNDDRKNELTLFASIFWTFLDSALCPLTWLVGVWSSLGILSPDYLDLNGMAILFLIINRQLLKKKKWRSLKSKSGASSSVHSGECAYIVPCRGDLNGSSDTISPTELPHMHNSSKGVKYSASVKEEMGGNNLNTLNEADDEYDSHRLKRLLFSASNIIFPSDIGIYHSISFSSVKCETSSLTIMDSTNPAVELISAYFSVLTSLLGQSRMAKNWIPETIQKHSRNRNIPEIPETIH
ncbi:hypothetical protein X798_02454 [Onchocerca flexuosa]|uniref:Uncharacterized protein n=1 Tax=Onchocerca flexuosa TaxID=387005 RepID=A0A238BYT3_9BILA|nr:hypothetical protein X798_02454 [Onchocerca flexuosa]